MIVHGYRYSGVFDSSILTRFPIFDIETTETDKGKFVDVHFSYKIPPYLLYTPRGEEVVLSDLLNKAKRVALASGKPKLERYEFRYIYDYITRQKQPIACIVKDNTTDTYGVSAVSSAPNRIYKTFFADSYVAKEGDIIKIIHVTGISDDTKYDEHKMLVTSIEYGNKDVFTYKKAREQAIVNIGKDWKLIPNRKIYTDAGMLNLHDIIENIILDWDMS